MGVYWIDIEATGFVDGVDPKDPSAAVAHLRLSKEDATAYTVGRVKAGTMPEGVLSVMEAHVAADTDDVEDDTAKVFVSIRVLASLEDEDDVHGVQDLAGVKELLDDVSARMGVGFDLDHYEPNDWGDDVAIEDAYEGEVRGIMEARAADGPTPAP